MRDGKVIDRADIAGRGLAMMYRLGLRLTLRSGREPFVRLLVTAVAVAIGVAIMLGVLADFHAFTTTSNRPSWESTQGQAVTRDYPAATHAELWNYSNDIYRGQTIERLGRGRARTARAGPAGHCEAPGQRPVLRLAGAGRAASAPCRPDELGDRFPGRLAGTIGQQALTGPDELVIYVGYAPRQARRPARHDRW